MRNETKSLTDKQLRWVDEYLIDFNGAAAAVRAGYREKSARSIAHENATKPDIQAVLRERQAATATELHISRTGVIKGLLEAAEIGREQRNPSAMVLSASNPPPAPAKRWTVLSRCSLLGAGVAWFDICEQG